MPLTPADVHNVAFKKPPIGKRGYDDEEVDAFLDLVEAELARLIEENQHLRAQVSELEGRLGNGGGAAQPAQDSTATGQYAALQQSAALQEAQPAQPQPEAPPAAEQTGPQQQVPAAPPMSSASFQEGLSEHEKASRILALASETADRHLAEARAEAERSLTEARSQADQQVSGARENSERQVRDAQSQADQTMAEARSKADAVLSESQQQAAATERAAQAKAQELTSAAQRREADILRGLADRKAALERRIEALRKFEAEYRSRVHGFLQNQIKELESQPPLEPDEPDVPDVNASSSDSGAYSFSGGGSNGDTRNAPVSGFVGAPDSGRPDQG